MENVSDLKNIYTKLTIPHIVAICDVYEDFYGEASNRVPLAQKYREGLTIILDALVESGQVPCYDSDDAMIERYRHHTDIKLKLPKSAAKESNDGISSIPKERSPDHNADCADNNSDLDSMDNALDSRRSSDASETSPESMGGESEQSSNRPPPEDIRSRLRSAIESATADVLTPTIQLDPSVFSPDVSQIPEAGTFQLNIDEQPMISEEEYQQLIDLGGDAVIDQYGDTPPGVLAIRMAYALVHKNRYGSEYARQVTSGFLSHTRKGLAEGGS